MNSDLKEELLAKANARELTDAEGKELIALFEEEFSKLKDENPGAYLKALGNLQYQISLSNPEEE